jgi:hypothetical protein
LIEFVKGRQADLLCDVARTPHFVRPLALVRERHDVHGQLMLIPIHLVQARLHA